MGETVEIASNGRTVGGYVAAPEGGGPGIVVIQEWWGLVDHIKDVCDRFAAEGFVALAPDLYDGEATTEPDEAAKLMMALNVERAARDLEGALDHLAGRDDVTGEGIGVVGFCMGGGLATFLATLRPDLVKAVVPFYGVVPWEAAQPDWARLEGAVLGHYADRDAFLPRDEVHRLEQHLRGLGKDVELQVYEGTDHGFFNDSRPEIHDPEAAALAWERTLTFLEARLR